MTLKSKAENEQTKHQNLRILFEKTKAMIHK